jgi:hypothetical protein
MVVQWWFNGGSMIVQWWFKDCLVAAQFLVTPSTTIEQLLNNC